MNGARGPGTQTTGRALEFAQSWRALLGCTIAAAVGTVGMNAYTGGAFVAAITAERLFTRTQLSLATLLLSVTVAIAAPFAGMAMDRWGPVRVISISLVGEAIAFSLLGLPASFLFYALGAVLLGLVGVGTTPPGFARIVTGRFDSARGLALGVVVSGLGLMAMSAPIWASALIAATGWRTAYVAAAAFGVSALGCFLLLVDTPLVLAVAALAIGLTIGAELDIMAYVLSRYFGLDSFGRLYGLAYAGLITAGGVSPLLISLIADHASYSAAFIASGIGTILGSIVLLTLRPVRSRPA